MRSIHLSVMDNVLRKLRRQRDIAYAIWEQTPAVAGTVDPLGDATLADVFKRETAVKRILSYRHQLEYENMHA